MMARPPAWHVDMPRCPRCDFLYNVPLPYRAPRRDCLRCGRDLTLPPTDRERDDAAVRRDMKAEHERQAEHERRRREEKQERLRAALSDGTCIGCRGSRHWLSRLFWPGCEECGAPHCWRCCRRTWEFGFLGSHWTCLHCGHRHSANGPYFPGI